MGAMQASTSPAGNSLEQAAVSHLQRGEFDAAWKAAEEGILLSGEDRCTRAFWHFRLVRAQVLTIRGRVEEALRYIESLGSPCDHDPISKASLSMYRGYWLAMLGNYKSAHAFLEEAAALASSSGLFELQGEVQVRQAMVAYLEKKFDLSRTFYQSVVEVHAGRYGPYLYAVALCGVGKTLMAQKQYQEALTWFRRALETAREAGLALIYAAVVSEIGVCHTGLGDFERALEVHLAADKVLHSLGAMQHYQVNLADTGNIYLQRGDFPTAISYYQRALEIAVQIKHPASIEKWNHNIRLAHTKWKKAIDESVNSM